MDVTKDSMITALRRVGVLGTVESGYFDKLFEDSDPNTANGFGFFNYGNSIPSQTPVPGEWTTLLNDTNGIYTTTEFAPPGVTRMIDPLTGRLLLDQLDVGDELYIRHTLNVIPLMNNLSYQLSHLNGSVEQAYRLPLGNKTTLVGGAIPTDIFVVETRIYIRNEDVRTNGILPQILLSGEGRVEYQGCYISVNRR